MHLLGHLCDPIVLASLNYARVFKVGLLRLAQPGSHAGGYRIFVILGSEALRRVQGGAICFTSSVPPPRQF